MMIKLIHVSESGNVGTNIDNENISASSDESPFPTTTTTGIVNKAAKESGNKLDEKQMIFYETIGATFFFVCQ